MMNNKQFCRLFATTSQSTLKKTALYDFHVSHGGKMVPFAGWLMPVQYSDMGIAQSTKHCRQFASIFDVSHMLQTRLFGTDRLRLLEKLTVADLQSLAVQQSTLSVFTNANGGIIDDTIINVQPGHFYIVSNAGCADKDYEHIRSQIDKFQGDVRFERITGKSLLALQGPLSVAVLEKLSKQSLHQFAFMSTRKFTLGGVECHVSRSGYTGEDGFEIQVDDGKAVALTELLLDADDNVKMAGLGARDSLRLEAGMCLYGHDLDETTSPVEAGLTWVVGKRRRSEGGFLGDAVVQTHLTNGVDRRRVGLLVDGAPAREGALLFDADGVQVGQVTSGAPSPNLGKNIAMAYVKSGYHKSGTELVVRVRQRDQKAVVTKMPFVQTRYHKV